MEAHIDYIRPFKSMDVASERLLAAGFQEITRGIDAQGERFFIYESPDYILESSVYTTTSGVTISLRFALCQPTSTDEKHCSLLQEISQDIRTVENSKILQEIAEDREEWKARFGDHVMKASCETALRTFLLLVPEI